MKRKKYLLLLLSISICYLLFGCENTEESVNIEGWKLFYVDSTEYKIVSEPFIQTGSTIEELLEEYIKGLERPPEEFGHKKAKPDDVQIKNYKYQDSGVLTLYFDASYYSMSSVTELLCRAVIVKTLCQIEGVDYIEFFVNEQPLVLSGEVQGMMKQDDFVDNTGEQSAFKQTVLLTVYFTDDSGSCLHDSVLEVDYDGSKTMEQLVVEQVLCGPVKGKSDLRPVISPKTKLLKVTTTNGICYVNLDENFLKKVSGVAPEVTVYAIVNSLIELTSVNKVQLSVNGEEIEKFHDMDFSVPLDRNLELVKNNKAGEN